MKSKHLKIIILLIIVALVYAFLAYDLGQYLTIDFFKTKQLAFEQYYAGHQVLTILIYMGVYIVVTALSLPGAAVMTLAGGALFGLWLGTLAVSFASTIGATLAFIVARFLLRETVQKKFGEKLTAINEGVRRDGAFYLFTLRLVPIFPFFIINLLIIARHLIS